MPPTEAEAVLSAANKAANTASDVWLAACDTHGPFSPEASAAWDAYRAAANAANEAAILVVEEADAPTIQATLEALLEDTLTPPAP